VEKTPIYLAAEKLAEIVSDESSHSRPAPLETIDMQIRQEIVDIEREFSTEEQFEILRLFFLMLSKRSISPLKVVNACFFLKRIKAKIPAFPFAKCEAAFLREDPEAVQILLGKSAHTLE
jgi:hypothetical protein